MAAGRLPEGKEQFTVVLLRLNEPITVLQSCNKSLGGRGEEEKKRRGEEEEEKRRRRREAAKRWRRRGEEKRRRGGGEGKVERQKE